MSQQQRITNILGAGTFSLLFQPKLRAACDELGGTASLLTQGALDINNATFTAPTQYGKNGVKDVSPSPKKVANAIGFAGSDEIALQNRDHWYPLAYSLIDRVIQAHLQRRLVDGQGLWLMGLRTGHGQPAEEMLREFKTRLPRHYTVGMSTMPDNADKRDKLREGHDLFVRLKDEGLLETTILLDNRSPFATHFDLDVQDRYAAKALATLIAAQGQNGKNPSLAEISRSLGEYGAFVGVAMRSRSLVAGREYPGWGLLRGLGLPSRGFGDLDNVLLEAQEATKQVLTDPSALAIDEVIDLHKPVFVAYTIPIPTTDKRWITFSSKLRSFLANQYPSVVPVLASGQGTPVPHRTSAYWLQASAFFPMPDVPAPIRAILDSPSLKRRKPASPSAPQAGLPSPMGNGEIADHDAIASKTRVIARQ